MRVLWLGAEMNRFSLLEEELGAVARLPGPAALKAS